MLLPLGDDNRDRRTTPVVNYILIIINIINVNKILNLYFLNMGGKESTLKVII